MRVALVYDRLNKLGGAEHVLTSFHILFPQADWYTSVWDPSRAPFSRHWRVHTSWLSRIPFLRTHHEFIPYLMPFVFESFDLRGYDLVISIGSAESKGVLTLPDTTHLNYCLTPTRYLYSHKEQYLTTPIHRFIAKYLRAWDQVASTRPDTMIAISTQVKKRIKKYYNRNSEIIFPPVDTNRFKPSRSVLVGDYFLTVSRLVPYKNIDVLVKAF
ncbi:MAG: glycosyltransferase family 4 protein, partial [Candidatus Kaiserbacteria bacterium]|nr:glycosyltransferase family 4 protein [Candidatus Kaiserbacteria bacterium]